MIEVMADVKVIGQMDNTIDHTFESANRVYDVEGVAPTMNTCGGGGLQPKILENKIVAMRGRNPDNPSDRTAGSPTEQRLEMNMQGTSNCLTSVQKDNLVMDKMLLIAKDGEKTSVAVLEPQPIKILTDEIKNPILLGGVGEENEFGKQYRQGNRVYSSDACAMALNSQPVGNAGGNSYLYNVGYRIRKLTPRECGRLMGVSDEDINKMAAVNSNTQLYKQFGNSIVVDVMCAMFKNLNINQ